MKYFNLFTSQIFKVALAWLLLGVPAVQAEELWTNSDVGIVGSVGSSTYNGTSDAFTVQGSGNGFGAVSDGCQFVHVPMEGNMELTARVSSLTGSNPFAIAGLMIRESLDDASKIALVTVSSGNGVNFTYRGSEILASETILGPSQQSPVWLRLVKSGYSIAGYQSIDGVNWTLVGTKAIELDKYYIGLAVSSTQPGVLDQAVFERVTVLSHVPQINSSLKLWLRSDVGIVKNGSGLVSKWEDQSGNANHLLQATGASQPAWTDNILNGLPVLRFDGSNDILSVSDRTGLKPSELTLVVVGKQVSASAWAPYLIKGPTSWNSGYGLLTNSGSTGGFWVNNYNGGNANSPADTSYHSYVGRYSVANGKVELFKDGFLTSRTYTTAITNSTQSLKVGGDGTAFHNGDIAEILLYDRALTNAERSELQAYLYQKYGLGSLPDTGSAPVPSKISGVYGGSINVAFVVPAGFELRYTLDGSDPTSASALYGLPIYISSTITLKYRLFRNGYLPGAVSSQVYVIDSNASDVSRSGLALWFRADSLNGVSGSAVSSWVDLSGSGVVAAQVTAANQPTLQASVIGGQSVIRFDGSNDFLNLGSTFPNSTQMTAIAVFKNNGTGINTIFSDSDSAAGNDMAWRFNPANIAVMANKTGGTLNSTFATTVTGTRILTWVMGTNSKVYNNGALVATIAQVGSNVGYHPPFPSIGRNWDTGPTNTDYLNADLAELIVYSREITDDERRDIEAYVYARYGAGTQPVTGPAPAPSILGGTYGGATSISFSVPSGFTLHYTLDGNDPTSASAQFSSAISISSSATLKYRLFRNGYLPGAVSSQTYTIDAATAGVIHTGLALWLKADSLSGIDGTVVSAWTDQSGNQLDVTQGTAGNRPTLRNSVGTLINGKPVVRFDGSNDFLSGIATGNLAPSQHTLIAVYKNGVNNGDSKIISKAYRQAGWTSPFVSWELKTGSGTDGKPTSSLATSSSSGVGASSPIVVPLGTPTLLLAQNDGTKHRLYVNGALVRDNALTQAISYGDGATFCVGGRSTYSNGEYLNGDIAEILFYNRAISEEERRNIDAYIFQRYGIGSQPTVLAPSLSLKGGTYSTAPQVTINAETGASIYYTVDGSAPTAGSLLYSGTISVSSSQTIRAIAVKAGYLNSSIISEKFVIDANTGGVTHSGLAVWLRADEGVSLNGSTVSQWVDQSGNGNHTTQATSANQPVFTTGALNGKPALTFDGTADFLQFGSGFSDFTQGASFVVVAKPTAISNNSRFVEFGNGNSSDNLALARNGTTSGLKFVVYTGATSTSFSSASGMVVGSYQVLTGTWSSSGGVSLYSNGALLAQGTTGLLNNISRAQNYVGKSAGTGNSLYQGDICEILVYNRTISDAERRNIEAYVFAKYVVGNAPVASSAPTPSILGGTYGRITNVEFFVPAGFELRYTLDGNDPTLSSDRYEGPIVVSASAVLKYRLFGQGYAPGPVSSQSYVIDPTTQPVSRMGLGLWLKADSLSGIDGTAVSAWADQSGNQVNVFQGTAGNQPTLRNSIINGKPVVRFDGANDFLSGTTNVSLTPPQHTLITVYRNAANASNSHIIARSYRQSGWTAPYIAWELKTGSGTDGKPGSYLATSSSASTGIYSSTAISLNTPTLLIGQNDGSKLKVYLNGNLANEGALTQPISYGDSNTFCLGSRSTYSNGEYLNGDIAEVLFYNRAISDDERRDIEAYIYQKYLIGQPTTQSPAFSLSAGTYGAAQSVTITGEAGANIYYTTDGNNPTPSSTPYTGPVVVGSNMVLKAIAVKSGYQLSGVTSASYAIDSSTFNVTRNGLVTWFKADALSGSSGSAVSLWSDQSGNSNYATQSTGVRQPTFQSAALNGLPVVRFAGQQYLQVQNPAAFNLSTLTLFVVGKSPVADGTFLAKNDINTATSAVSRRKLQVKAGLLFQSGSDSNLVIYSGTPLNVFHTYSVTSYANNQHTLTLDGTTQNFTTSLDLTTFNAVPLLIGGAFTGLFENLNGDIAEILIYNRALNAGERFEVTSYLNKKYNLNAPAVPVPQVSVPGGSLSGPAQVAIQVPPGYLVYYTVDGSEPTTASLLYTGPIDVNYTQTIKAKAFLNGVAVSTTTTATYTLDPGLYPGPQYDPNDHTAPVITLQLPTNAVLQ